MACTTTTIYKDIKKCQGTKSYPGVRTHVYGISKNDIVTWPTIPASPKTLEEAVTYVGDFVLAADKKWHYLGMVTDQGQLQTESQGTEGSKTHKVTGTIVMPGTEEDVTGYIDQANNDSMVYLFVQRNGKARVCGCEEFDATLTVSQDTGQGVTDTNATTVSVEATDPHPAPFYPGKIETEDGDISGATGKAWEEAAASGNG